MLKPGCVPAVIYFVNARDPAHSPGYIMLAPYTDFPTPFGYDRCGADTLREIDKLQAKLQQQEYAAGQQELADDEARLSAARDRVRDSLYAQLTSSATSEFEKEFIRNYLQLRDGEKRKRYQQRYLERSMYLYAREMDLHGRDASKEEWRGTADVKNG